MLIVEVVSHEILSNRLNILVEPYTVAEDEKTSFDTLYFFSWHPKDFLSLANYFPI